MKIIIDIGHPAHVHYFKNFIQIMKKSDHGVLVTARNKEVVHSLLNSFEIKYIDRGKGKKGLLGKLIYMFKADLLLLKLSLKYKPDIFMSFASPYAALISWLLRKPHIAFTDTEHATLGNLAFIPFSQVVCTPSSFNKDLGKKHVRFNGFMELCYLHPNYFVPDPIVLNMLGVIKGEKYIILRFISWNASHDVGHSGLSLDVKHKAVKELSMHAKVFISSEGELPEDLQKYKIKIPPEKMHDALYYSTLYLGESGTMAVEAAILGTPSITVSTLSKLLGNFQELSEKYELIHFFDEGAVGLKKAIELIVDPESKSNWQKKAQKLIEDKIDVTQYMITFIEHYKKKDR
ncbi:MAG: DUF354 domain-containing protein [Bacteroidetes bacterium]|nr:DUF354 domain-containing protein [Bacteroidota bacterium]